MAQRSSADIQKDIDKTFAAIAYYTKERDDAQNNYDAWHQLCFKQDCTKDNTAKNAMQSYEDIKNHAQQNIDAQNVLLAGYQTEFKNATGYESALTPQQQAINDAAVAKQKNYRTALIVASIIVGVVVIIWAWAKYIRK